MIIVRLTGGLGNQLFQYAAARRLADLHNTELKLDISFLGSHRENCTPRGFQLNHMAITASVAAHHEIANITGKKSPLRYVASRISDVTGLSRRHRSVFNERSFNFDPEVLSLPDNIYLVGYWQSEKYFQDIKDIIRKEFALNCPLEDRDKEIADLIKASNSVSVHIRRGDFVADAQVNKVHGVCSLDYYSRCIETIADKAGKVHLFVFSDEPSWVSDKIKFSAPVTIVDHNSTVTSYQDIRLMSQCRHHIIANSSFSWWGAWLANDPYKQVIAPERWFNDSSLDTSDLIPSNWQRL